MHVSSYGGILDGNNTTNKAIRTLKEEVSAYIVFFTRLKREERILEAMGWKKYADTIKNPLWPQRVTISQWPPLLMNATIQTLIRAW
jgi:hypothetical protein